MIVYPDENYNSYVSLEDSLIYFESRLNSDDFVNANDEIQEQALQTAFRSLSELNLSVDPSQPDELTALKNAQCEQALHELKNDPDSAALSSLSLGGVLSVKIPEAKTPPPRFSKRALSILRSYLSGRTVNRTR